MNSWDRDGEAYALQAAVHNTNFVKVARSFDNVRELEGPR